MRRVVPPKTPTKSKKRPRRYHEVDLETIEVAAENPDWLVGAY